MALRSDWKVTHYNHAGTPLGEVFPENLSFHLYLDAIGDIQYDMDLIHPLAVKSSTRPYYTDYKLSWGTHDLQAGIHTGINIDDDNQDVLQVSGLDWLHYFEGCFWPFDPASPVANLYQQAGRDIALIVKDLLDACLAQSNRLAFAYALTAIGQTSDYQIGPADTTNLLDRISTLSKLKPGFDYDVSADLTRTFTIYPFHKGNQNNPYIFDEAVNCSSVSYSNNGPKGTHILGVATTASGGQVGQIVEAANQADARRWDVEESFDVVSSVAQLTAYTAGAADRDSADQITFSLKYVPVAGEDIFALVGIGDVVRCRATLKGYDSIDDYFRIVGIEGSPTDEGEVELIFTFDYGTLSL